MSNTRNIVKVFLGSPSDLSDERKAAKEVVDEFNATWAEELGYQVQLVGWEDTVSVWGRPQETINRDLEQCELFIGLMWKKWGTPPSTGGPHTSGFEEEFRLSAERRSLTGKPEISLFFKSISADLLLDPGRELKKVLAFKDELIAGKRVLFQNFNDLPEFEQLVRKSISSYVQRLVKAEREVEEDANASSLPKDDAGENLKRKGDESRSRLMGAEEGEFLKHLAERDDTQEIMPTEAARLRTIAYGQSTTSNDHDVLGPHDANLMFGARNRLVVGFREKYVLFDAGLARLEHQNAPLWHWLLSLGGRPADQLAIESLAGSTDAIRAGAIRAMSLIEHSIGDYAGLDRETLIDSWLGENEPSTVKQAALNYLRHHGVKRDCDVLKSEMSRGDHATIRSSAQAILAISLREGKADAVEAMLELQVETIEPVLLKKLVEALASATEQQIEMALGHRAPEVRLAALQEAIGRPSTNLSLVERLLDDPTANVRYLALRTLEDRGRVFSTDQVRLILIKRRKNALAWSLMSGSDSQGEANWEEYKARSYSALKTSHLLDVFISDGPLEPWAYMELARRGSHIAPFDFRADLRDQFNSRSNDLLNSFEKLFGDSANIVSRARDLSQFTRKTFYRQALTYLTTLNDSRDLSLVRECVDAQFAEGDLAEVEYLVRNGDWSDISRIADAGQRAVVGLGMAGMDRRSSILEVVGKGVVKLAGGRIADLFTLALPSSVLEYVLKALPLAKIRMIDDGVFLDLFQNAKDEVRRSAALRAVQALTKTRITSLLESYEEKEGMKYYNVIFWLDLGACSFDEALRRRAAGAALSRFN